MASPKKERDQDLTRQVQKFLTDAGIAVDVEVRDGVAHLTGLVPTPEIRDAAIDLARMVDGVNEIDDEIDYETIAPDSEFERPDEAADAQFGYADRQALADEESDTEVDYTGDVGSESSDFQRSVEEGEPYFPPTDPVVKPSTDDEALQVVGGLQDTSMEEMATEEDEQPGDEMDELDEYRERDDEDIRDDVLRELTEDALTTDLKLTVDVINGVVFLHGTLDSVDDAENAESVAGRIPGVKEVRDMTETAS